MTATTELFRRTGAPHTGATRTDEKGKAYTTEPRICDRCGGAGGSEAWKFTGWTCYKCGGHRTLGTRVVKLYTADELAKLNARAEKAAARKAAKVAAAEAAHAAEVAARTAAFLAEHGALIERAEAVAEHNAFVRDVAYKGRTNAALTEPQALALAEAVAKVEAELAVRAASRHVGAIGERLRDVPVTVERIATFERAAFRGWHTEICAITTMRTDDGAAIVAKSTTFRPEKGERFLLTATIKGHDEYKGEAQTVVNRPVAKPLPEAAAAEAA